MRRIVVVGASASGLAAAETLRSKGFDGELHIVGDEVELPYDRPPLSKQFLRGVWQEERLTLRSESAIASLNAQWRLGVAASALDVSRRIVTLADGRTLPFDGLVVATGAHARILPICDGVAGVYVLRDIGHARNLQQAVATARSVAVIGAGFLGMEATATFTELGLPVTMIDPDPEPLASRVGHAVASRLIALHRKHGVDVRCGTLVHSIGSAGGQASHVVLSTGDVVDADLILVAVGATPAVGWLRDSGLAIDDGVVCNEYLEAAPGVVAAGDVARWQHPQRGLLRIEHRLNAAEQGAAAASTLLGHRTPFASIPYFWTDQYDVKVQAYGATHDGLTTRVVAGDLNSDRFALQYGDGTRVVGGLSWNLPRAALQLRSDIAQDLLPQP